MSTENRSPRCVAAAALLLVGLVCQPGCTALPDKLQEKLQESRYAEVVGEGEAFLAEGEGEPAEIGRVRLILARAYFAQAGRIDKVQAYRDVRSKLNPWPEASPQSSAPGLCW